MRGVQVGWLIAIAGTGFWLGLMYASSVLGGWSTLARVYRGTQPFKGRVWHGQFVAMRHYWGYGLISVGASSEGLHLSVFVLGRMQFHPALFIPWRDVTSGGARSSKGVLQGRAEIPSSTGRLCEDQRIALVQQFETRTVEDQCRFQFSREVTELTAINGVF